MAEDDKDKLAPLEPKKKRATVPLAWRAEYLLGDMQKLAAFAREMGFEEAASFIGMAMIAVTDLVEKGETDGKDKRA